VRPADGARAKVSRMKLSSGRGADVGGGKFGGLAIIRGEFTVAYSRKLGCLNGRESRRDQVCPRNAIRVPCQCQWPVQSMMTPLQAGRE